MLFNSLTFFYFFIVVLTVNYLLPLSKRNIWILFISCIFYMSWSPPYILLLLFTALFDYFLALKIDSSRDQTTKKRWLILSLVFSLGSLAFFKYTTMAVESSQSILDLLGIAFILPSIEITLPLGISFYTFETISYTVDVYRGDLKPKKSFFEYLCFLMFFPKLIAGPIVRASELLYQIPKPRLIEKAHIPEALNLLLLGFTKKILFADNIAPFVEKVFAAPASSNRYMCIAAIYGYSMQVYLDFSAYTDIARACAKFLGFQLPENFNKPYLATSISDFWRKWHMTLSRWLRDYLFIPLGGSKGGKILTYRNLMITMVLGGLWHGANWTFVAWGTLNGFFLVVEKIYYDYKGQKVPHGETMSLLEKLIRIVVVFHLITFTRIFFRSPDFKTALTMMGSVINPTSFTATDDFGLFAIPVFCIAYACLANLKPQLMAIKPKGFMNIFYGLWLFLLLALGASNAEFIYFQF